MKFAFQPLALISYKNKILHELGHATLELANPHLQHYSDEALKHKKLLRSALCEDYIQYSKKRHNLVPIQQGVAKLIYGYARQYPVYEHTAEHLCFGLEAIVHSEKAAISVAPNYVQALKNYVSFEKNRRIENSRPTKLAFVSSDHIPHQKPPRSAYSSKIGSSAEPPVQSRNTHNNGKPIHPDEVLMPEHKTSKPRAAIGKQPDILIQPAIANKFNLFKTTLKFGETGLSVLAFYNFAKESGERYAYLKDENPHLHAECRGRCRCCAIRFTIYIMGCNL